MLNYPSEFSVSYRSVIFSMGTLYVCGLEICKFFRGNTLEVLEDDCSENGSPLELADFIRCSHMYPLMDERMMGISYIGTFEYNITLLPMYSIERIK